MMHREIVEEGTPGTGGMTNADFEALSDLMYRLTGISLDRGARQIVHSRLSRHVRESEAASFSQFIERLTSGMYPGEVETVISALTTNTTRFFREMEHFDLFAQDVVPRIRHKAKTGGRVRIWSAACSSGEEAFSIAAVLLRHFPEAGAYDVRILGTDIDRTVLAKAERGRYRRPNPSDVDAAYMAILFKPCPDRGAELEISDDLRGLVAFRYLNFVEPWPVSGPFDAIFCRNAAIYMNGEIQSRLWAGLEAVLAPDGTLFIGHSERLSPNVAAKFNQFGRTAFKRRPASQLQSKGPQECQ